MVSHFTQTRHFAHLMQQIDSQMGVKSGRKEESREHLKPNPEAGRIQSPIVHRASQPDCVPRRRSRQEGYNSAGDESGIGRVQPWEDSAVP